MLSKVQDPDTAGAAKAREGVVAGGGAVIKGPGQCSLFFHDWALGADSSKLMG
jgi:hypothetical protein